MKKIISILLSFILLLSIVPFSVTTNAEEVIDTESVEQFCDDLNKMIDEYSDSDYVTPDFIEEETTATVDNELDINYCPRLIVQSDKRIDTYNAIEVVSGFFNFYVLQFKNETDTNFAYEKYSNDKAIISVDYDVSYQAVTLSTEEMADTELTYEDYKNGWYMESTGMNKVLEKYENEDLPKVVVAVIDTGVDLNSEYLKDRIEPTGFNNAGDGDEGSEQDYFDHGTAVTSVIANCTSQNVIIRNYRCIASDGTLKSGSLACAAILEAIYNGANVINCSFIYTNTFNLMVETIQYAYSNQVLIIAGAGNFPNDLGLSLASPLNSSDYTITAGSHNKHNVPSAFSAYGKSIDVLAPGENIPVIQLNDIICESSGTSFSSPIMASIYAMYYAIHQDISFENRIRAIEGCGSGVDQGYVTEYFGSGVANALPLFELDTVQEPIFSHKEGKYVGKVSLELTSEEGADIYYTTDQSYPSPANGTLYTGPIEFIDEEMSIRAVAYKNGNRSNYVYKLIYAMVPGTDDMFAINEDGVITEYKGNVKYLKIPEVINGITVKDISSFSGFDKAELYGIILPDTVEYIGYTIDYYDRLLTEDEQFSLFEKSETLEFIVGNGIKVIGYYGLSFIPKLKEVEFPNCEEIMCAGFYESTIVGAEFPKVKKVDKEAFYNSYIREIYLPECEEIGSQAFALCTFLKIIYAPKTDFLEKQEFIDKTFSSKDSDATEMFFNQCEKLQEVDLPALRTIGKSSFIQTAVKDISLSSVEYIYDLPNTIWYSNSSYYGNYYYPVPIALSFPSTLQYCVSATDYKNEFINYVVYGTSGIGSYAESWAKENDIEFVNLSPETSIVEDIETIWDECSYKPLEFNARGFNRTYQWYGSYDNKICDDIAISNATTNEFTPDENNEFPYYYCKMISTDINCDGEVVSSFEVFSSLCENKLYSDVSKETILSSMTSQIRFSRNNDGSYANMFDVRTRAKITDEDFKTYIADTNDEAVKKISKVGFVYSRGSNNFSTENAKKVAQGKHIDGYADAPVSYIQDAEGYYMFTCLVVDIPVEDMKENLTTYAYICVDDKWYFFDAEVTADFNSLHSTYYPQAAEKYGWEV